MLVSIIILNLNGKKLLKNCLDSIYNQNYSPIEIIVVDNGSQDGSVEFLKTNYSDIKVIVKQRNIGFAEGNNIGVKKAKSNLVVLLNNDTIVDKNWLSELVKASSRKEIAVVGSKVITDGVPPEYYQMNGTLNLLGYSIMRVFENLQKSFSVSGCSLLFKKNLLGVPFDGEYFAYSEDVFLCWRARLKGYRVIYQPSSVVYHLGSATMKLQDLSMSFYQQRNRLLNLFLFYEPFTLLRILPFLVFDFLGKFSLSLFKGADIFFSMIKAYIWFLKNAKMVVKKRKSYQKNRIISDREIIKLMSCKVVNRQNFSGKFLNFLSFKYCRLSGLKTTEVY